MAGMRRTAVVLTTVAVATIGTVGLADVFSGSTAIAAELPAFNDCAGLQSWVDKAAAQEAKSGGYQTNAGITMSAPGSAGAGEGTAAVPQRAVAAAPLSAGAGSASTGSAATDGVGSSATGTNVQEAGVDEPDQIKTDGHYIVGITGSRLYVAEIAGHTPHVIGKLRLSGGATSLLLAGHRALVMVQPGVAYAVPGGVEPMGGPAVDVAPGAAGSMPIRPYSQQSRLEVVDLSDPHAPSVVAREDVTGDVMTARQVGNIAWVVTQSQPKTRLNPGSGSPGVLPQRKVRDSHGSVVSSGDALSCTSVRHPIAYSGSQLLTVQPVDITGDKPFTSGHSAGVVASGGYVYASAKRLYVATNSWGMTATTSIHAFDISNAKAASYLASGVVRGTLLSQWAMSEQNGYLRVATTSGSVVPPKGEGVAPSIADQSQTSVVVLAERGKLLKQVGRVGGLGRGEKVWAVRFMGDLAAVVTFRQTDPLYLVDLSQPTKPRLRGALELTGYSSYLHPVGDGLLLGIGRDADSVGHVLDAKATLFDVRDVAHPKKVSSIDLGPGWSDIDGDAHAFTYLPDRHLALLPLTSGSAAASIKVDGSKLGIAGQLTGVDFVQRFLPVGNEVAALASGQMSDVNQSAQDHLLDVDPFALDVLGQTPLPQ